MSEGSNVPLFEPGGRLSGKRLSPAVDEIFEILEDRLAELGRSMFLPLDLLVVLLERNHGSLARLIAVGTEGVVESDDVARRLRVLAGEVDTDAEVDTQRPERCLSNFSRGFSRILREAAEQAEDRGADRLRESDLVRSVVWRAEAVESASIRWAIRRLGEGEGDALFDERGLLKLNVFDKACTGILEGAMKLAASHGTSFLGTPHLIAMMASIRDSVIWRSAEARGLEPSRLREELIRLIGSKPEPIPEFLIGRKTLTPRMIRMLQASASDDDHNRVGEHDLVEAFLDDGGSSLELVQALGLESEIRNALGEPRVLAGTQPVEAAIEFASERRASPTLDTLGRDLTQEALAGQLPTIVGRKRELTRVFNVLMRREQRNPLLIGEAGVGKTALAVGLAQHIAAGRGPEKLSGYRVIEINGASLMSGTSYRGDLEARIESLLEEASRSVILFIDEAHAVFSPRSGSNTPGEVPNHFKRALASGKIAVVGATTQDEYRRWFEKDPALKRRFESIEIQEPERPLVRDILASLVPELEEEYGVEISERATEEAIELSVRYLPEQRLPDKAKKLVMDACIARANPMCDDLEGESMGVADDRGDAEATPTVDRRDIARQVHLKTSIPMNRLLTGEINWWEGLEQRLTDAVVGQDKAMRQVARVLVGSRLKSGDTPRPLSVLAFVGPGGVGKATAARALAQEVFGDRRALIRLDMTDYQQSHALSRLIGSPPGYVGYEDADMLVTPLRKRPSSVVLLEDFDRAHPHIQDRLLRLIEEGQLGDSQGRRADATNAVFVLTMTTESAVSTEPIGFASSSSGDDGVPDEVSDDPVFERIERRVDGVVSFAGLSDDGHAGVAALLRSLLERFADNLKDEYGVDVEITDQVIDVLDDKVRNCSETRQVESVVEELVVEPTVRRLLGSDGVRDLAIVWDEDVDEIVVDIMTEGAPS